MAELANCAHCNELFAKSNLRDICHNCWKEEEKSYELVHRFIRQRQNRAATMQQVVNATQVEETLIQKFVRTGRLRAAHFPNLGYPCDSCGAIIQTGQLCTECAAELRNDLNEYDAAEKRKNERAENAQAAYFSKI